MYDVTREGPHYLHGLFPATSLGFLLRCCELDWFRCCRCFRPRWLCLSCCSACPHCAPFPPSAWGVAGSPSETMSCRSSCIVADGAPRRRPAFSCTVPFCSAVVAAVASVFIRYAVCGSVPPLHTSIACCWACFQSFHLCCNPSDGYFFAVHDLFCCQRWALDPDCA